MPPDGLTIGDVELDLCGLIGPEEEERDSRVVVCSAALSNEALVTEIELGLERLAIPEEYEVCVVSGSEFPIEGLAGAVVELGLGGLIGAEEEEECVVLCSTLLEAVLSLALELGL